MYKYIFAAILFPLFFSACSKKTVPAPINVVGLWRGKSSNVGNSNIDDVYYLFRSNGTVRYFLGTDTTTAINFDGTYTLLGNQLNTTYSQIFITPLVYSETNIVTADGKHFDGTYGSGIITVGGGVQSADKQ
jgi:hypothetical protein